MGKYDSGRRSLTNRKDKKASGASTPHGKTRFDFKITDSVKGKIDDGKRRALQRWKLKLGLRAGPLTGDRVIRKRTKTAYDVHFRGIATFCFLIGDYDSSLILDDFAPKYAPSMKVETLVLYLKFKYYEAHEFLTEANGEPVLDVDGNPIYCSGTWNDPGNADSECSP